MSASAAIWPPAVQEYSRVGEPQALPASGDPLLIEYGYLGGERATYRAGKRQFTAIAYRFKDATGAFAAAQLQPKAWVAKGNYALEVVEGRLAPSEIDVMFRDLESFRHTAPPLLAAYVPQGTGEVHSVLGAESLKTYLPQIPVSAAGLDFGLEAQVGDIQLAGKPARIAIFRFPNPQVARVKAAELAVALPTGVLKRTGPLVAVVWAKDATPLDPLAADKLLTPVEFKAIVIANEANPDAPVKEAAKMILSIFALAGILLAACVVGGGLFGGMRIFLRRKDDAGGPLQTLGL